MAHSDILSQPDRGLGLDRPQTEALLALFSRCDDLREFGREVIQSVVNALMDSQAQEACGAPRGSRSPERVNSRNGYRERSLSTSLGDLELRVPKLREGTYFPEGILERYTRVEASMVALVREMYVAVSVNIIFTISTNAFSPIAPTRIRRIRQRGCAAFGA